MKIPNNIFNRLVIGSSSVCNARCSYCVNENGFDKSIIPIDFDSWEFNRAIQNRYIQVTITGGEPFIDRSMGATEKCIKEFLPISDSVRLFSNGIATDNIVGMLDKYPGLKVTISIDLKKDKNKSSHLTSLPDKLLNYKDRVTTRVLIDVNDCSKINDTDYLNTIDDIDLLIYPYYPNDFSFVGTQFWDIFKNNELVRSKFGILTLGSNYYSDTLNMNCQTNDKRVNFNTRSCFRDCYFKWFELEDFCDYMTSKLGKYYESNKTCICKYMGRKNSFFTLLDNYDELETKKKLNDELIDRVMKRDYDTTQESLPIAINYLGYFESLDDFVKVSKYIGNLFNTKKDFSMHNFSRINHVSDEYCSVNFDNMVLSGKTSDLRTLLSDPLKYQLNHNSVYTRLFKECISKYL